MINKKITGIELEKLHSIIRETRHSKHLDKDENFLLILGAENGFLWERFVYKEKEWTSITL